MADDVLHRIQKDIDSNEILIYMKGTPEEPQCGFSAKVIEVFNRLHVPYATRDVLEDRELRQAIKQFSNWPTLPQVYIKGKFIGGADIVSELFENGQLESMVK